MKTLPLDPRLDAALPVFISAGALALLFGSLGHFAWVMPSVLGVMAGGLVDLDNGMAGRLKNTALTALLFSCTTLIVQATIGHAALFAAAMTALTFALTFAGAAGLRYRTIAFGALAVACYAALTHTPHAAWFSNTMLIVLGTLLYSAIRLLMQAIFPHRHVQLAMANAFDALAIYFEEKADSRISLLRHNGSGQRFVLLDLPGDAAVYRSLMSVRCAHLPEIYELAEEDGRLLVLEEFIPGEATGKH